VVFNTGPYTVLPDNSILITAYMQSEMGFPSSHQLKSYVASVPPEIGGALSCQRMLAFLLLLFSVYKAIFVICAFYVIMHVFVQLVHLCSQ